MLAPIQGVDPRIAMKAAATQLSALKLFADSNGEIIAHSGVKVGSFTRDISLASGTQAITGVGFKPSGIIFHTWKDNSPGGSWGFDDGTNSNRMQDQQNAVADAWSGTTGDSIEFLVSVGNEYTGHISSWNNDGFTLTWTKTGSPTGTINIQYLAFR